MRNFMAYQLVLLLLIFTSCRGPNPSMSWADWHRLNKVFQENDKLTQEKLLQRRLMKKQSEGSKWF